MQTSPGKTGDNTLQTFQVWQGKVRNLSNKENLYTRISKPQQKEKVWRKRVYEAQIYKNASLKKDFNITKNNKKGQ